MTGDKLRVAMRYFLLGLLWILPRRRRRHLERWLRGREEYLKLQRADWVLMSWGKSGRTWLRVMLSRFYQLKFGFDERELLDFDNLRKRNAQAPAVFFSHNNYLRDYTGNWESKRHFQGKKVVLLVRDPRDVAVSQYFQWRHRMKPGKKHLNNYPEHGSDVSIYQFVIDPDCGLPVIVDYFNGWLQAVAELDNVLVVRYEDMRVNAAEVLARILDFTEIPATAEQVGESVRFAEFDNMKKLEQQQHFRSARVKASDRDNPDSFKVRRAKIGGYRDYFDQAECAEIDSIVDRLDPSLGYGGQGAANGIGQNDRVC